MTLAHGRNAGGVAASKVKVYLLGDQVLVSAFVAHYSLLEALPVVCCTSHNFVPVKSDQNSFEFSVSDTNTSARQKLEPLEYQRHQQLLLTGVEDPRLIIWPGKGLFMMFGSKPWAHNPFSSDFSGKLCDGPLAFQQWLVLVEPYTPQPDPTDSWMQGVIRLQYDSPGRQAGGNGLTIEKNWNPFIYKGELLFSQAGHAYRCHLQQLLVATAELSNCHR